MLLLTGMLQHHAVNEPMQIYYLAPAGSATQFQLSNSLLQSLPPSNSLLHIVTMSAAATSGIFGDAAAPKKKEPKEKRHQLTKYDTVACKALDPYAVGILDDVSLPSLWKIVKKGDKFCKLFSELAGDSSNSPDPAIRVAVGISRYAEIMCNVITEWKGHEDLRKILKPEKVDLVDKEAEALLPHMQRLNFGKRDSKDPEDSFSTLKEAKRRKLDKGNVGGGSSSGTQLEASIGAMFDFLEQGTASDLRMVISLLSTGGVFFAAQSMDKTARAWLEHQEPKPTRQDAFLCVKARLASDTKGPQADVKFGREKATGSLLRD